MDDPFDNMSVTARKKMIGILLSLHEKGTSMIINTSMYPEMMGFITDVVVIEEGKNLTFGPVEEVYAEALCKSPVRMHILAQMEKALEVLKENHLVDRVTVDGDDVIFRFNGGEKEEAELLKDPEKNLSGWFGPAYGWEADEYFRDNQEFDMAGIHFKVLHTPGHTLGGCCYYDEADSCCFCGDTIFNGSVGRTDFYSGSARALIDSIQKRIFTLPPDTKLYPGHNEETTVAYEMKYNPCCR